MTDVQTAVAEDVMKFLDDEMTAGRISVYRTVLSVACLAIQQQGQPDRRMHLYDECTREWLSDFIWRTKTILLKRQEVDRIFCALAGRAMDVTHRCLEDPELLRLIESEPTLAVAVEFMEAREERRYEGSMQALWREWSALAKQRGLTRLGHARFPGGANVLSRKLTQLAPLLNQLGISVATWRSNGGRVAIERRREDDRDNVSSSQPSAPKTSDAKGLRKEDDRNTILKNLQNRNANLHSN